MLPDVFLAEPHAFQVRVQHLVSSLFAEFDEPAGVEDAGVVGEDIDAAELVECVLTGGFDLDLVANVHLHHE